MNNIQIGLIVFGCVTLSIAIGIKIGRATYKAMHLQSKENFGFKTLFHKDAHPIGEHGTIYVDCPAKGWKAEPITFVFQGIPASPKMSLDLMKKIWSDAERAGYIPLALRSYNQIHAIVKPARAPQEAVSGLELRVQEANRRKTEQMRQARANEVDAGILSKSANQAA